MGEITPSMVSTLGIIAAICLTIGYVVGWLISTLTAGQKREKQKQAEAAKPAPVPAIPAQRSLFRLMRDPDKGSLQVELTGKVIPSAEGLSLDERKQIASLMQEVAVWMGLQTSAPAAPAAPVQAPQPVGRQTGPLPQTPAAAPAVDAARPSVLGGMTTALADVINPGSTTAATVQKAPMSIVQQIDEILQRKLAGTPLEQTKIYMTEDARRNVVVWVGNTSYDGIGSVPEGPIKELIKSSVQEWERDQEKSQRRLGAV